MAEPHPTARDPRWALVAAAGLLVVAVIAWMVAEARSARDRHAADMADRARIRARQAEIEADLKAAHEERAKMIELLRRLPAVGSKQ